MPNAGSPSVQKGTDSEGPIPLRWRHDAVPCGRHLSAAVGTHGSDPGTAVPLSPAVPQFL